MQDNTLFIKAGTATPVIAYKTVSDLNQITPSDKSFLETAYQNGRYYVVSNSTDGKLYRWEDRGSGYQWYEFTSFIKGDSGDIAGLDDVDPNRIPMKDPVSGKLVSSPILDSTEGIRIEKEAVLEDGAAVIPNTIDVGDGLGLKAFGGFQINESYETGKLYGTLYQETGKQGTGLPFCGKLTPESHEVLQPDDSTALNSPVVLTNLTSSEDQQVNAFYLKTNGDVSNFRFKIVNTTTGRAFFHFPDKYKYEKNIGVSLTGAGIHKIDLFKDYVPTLYPKGINFEYSFAWDGTGKILGTSTDIPYYEVDRQLFTFITILQETDIADEPDKICEFNDDGSGNAQYPALDGSKITKVYSSDTVNNYKWGDRADVNPPSQWKMIYRKPFDDTKQKVVSADVVVDSSMSSGTLSIHIEDQKAHQIGYKDTSMTPGIHTVHIDATYDPGDSTTIFIYAMKDSGGTLYCTDVCLNMESK